MHPQRNRLSKIGVWTLGLIVVSLGSGAFAMTENTEHLAPCPASPNCVCSDEPATSPRHIPPIVSARHDSNDEGSNQSRLLLTAIAAYLAEQPGYQVLQLTEDKLTVAATTRLLRFVDDLEFRVRGDTVAVRSASRVGFSDLGKNRRRIEALRTAMIDQGFARSGPVSL